MESHRARDRRPVLQYRATRSRSRRSRRWRRSKAGRRRSSTPAGSHLPQHRADGEQMAQQRVGTAGANAPPENPTWYRWLPRPPQRASTMPRCSSPRRMWYVARSLSVQIVGFCRRSKDRIRAQRTSSLAVVWWWVLESDQSAKDGGRMLSLRLGKGGAGWLSCTHDEAAGAAAAALIRLAQRQLRCLRAVVRHRPAAPLLPAHVAPSA